jgi:hypothetical protein
VFVTRQLPGTALDRQCSRHSVTVWPERLLPSPGDLRRADGRTVLARIAIRGELAVIESHV